MHVHYHSHISYRKVKCYAFTLNKTVYTHAYSTSGFNLTNTRMYMTVSPFLCGWYYCVRACRKGTAHCTLIKMWFTGVKNVSAHLS